MYFDYNISVTAITLFAAAAVSLLYIIIVYGGRLRRVRRHRRLCDTPAGEDTPRLPSVSVIVYTNEDMDTLSDNLSLMLEQDYPGYFEVIVANDGTANETDDLVKILKTYYNNIRLTFAPDNSRNISRKKLTLTLGIKAAKGDVVVITDATTRILSPYWLRQMVAPYAREGVEVVLGYNNLNLPDGSWRGRQLTVFDYAADSVTWLSAAIKGKAYRGCGTNMSLRREVFYRSKGFAGSLNLNNGHDDIYINEITGPTNTAVQLSSGAIGACGRRQDIRKSMRQSRLSHAFTGRSLPKGARRVMAAGEWLMLAIPVLSAGGAYYAGVTNAMGWAIAAVLVIAEYISVAVMWSKTLLSLGAPKMFMTLPWMAAFRPLRNLKANLTCGFRGNPNYSWQ